MFVGALVALLLVVPAALESPALTLGVIGGMVLVGWLMKQGRFRLTLGLLVLMMLGASSSIEPWVAVSTYGRMVAVPLMLVVLFADTRRIAPQGTRPQRAVVGLLYAVSVVALATALWSVDPATTITQSMLLLALVVALHLLVTRRWTSRTVMVDDLRVVVVLVSLVLALGIIAHFLGVLPQTFSGRFQGLLNNPNMASQLAILTFFLGWGLFREKVTFWRLLILAPALVTLVLSESRTGVVAVAVGAFWLMIRSGARGVIAAASIAFAAVLYFALFGPGVFSVVLDRFGRVEAGDTLSGRSFIWEYAGQLAAQQPIGWGWGVTDTLLKSLYRNTGAGTSTGSIHNSYLQTLVEGGVVALALVVCIYLVLLIPLLKTRVSGMSAGLSGAVIAGAIGQFSESGIFGVGQVYPYMYWFSVVGLLAVYAAQMQATPFMVQHARPSRRMNRSMSPTATL